VNEKKGKRDTDMTGTEKKKPKSSKRERGALNDPESQSPSQVQWVVEDCVVDKERHLLIVLCAEA